MIVVTPGAPDANSYATVAEADAYNAARPYGTAWAALTPEAKEGALVYATLLLDGSFQWTGQATGTTVVPTASQPAPRDVFMYEYRYSTNTGTPPGSGQFQFNDIVYPYGAVTSVELHILTNSGVDIRTWLKSFPVGTIIYAQDQNEGAIFVRLQTTAVGVEVTPTTVRFNVTVMSVGTAALNNNQACELAFQMQDQIPSGPGPGEPNSEQLLCWPRVGMYTRNRQLIAAMHIPYELKMAQAEYARQASVADLTADNEAAKQGLSNVKAGSVSVSFHERSQADSLVLAGSGYSYLNVPGAVRILLVPSWYTAQPFLNTVAGRDYMFQVDR
jgi:hypothetical protein